MNNPISSDPEHALYPYPEGCTGHRIWKLLSQRTGATQEQYLEAFDRRNLVGGRAWSLSAAREALPGLREYARGRVVVVLGSEVRELLKLPRLLVHPLEVDGTVWRQLPHPSGRNHWYRVPGNREVAELLLEELYRGSDATPRQGVLL